MTAASFIASLVSSLAWPAVIVAILVIFHRQFGTMLDRLARVRLGAGAGGADADPDWSRAEADVRHSLAAARPALAGGAGRPSAGQGPGGQGPGGQGPGGQGPGGQGPAGQDAADRDPAAQQALVEARWQALTGELRDVIARAGAGQGRSPAAGFEQLLDTALAAGLLDSATVRSLDGLARLRNLARTSTGLTARQAQEFGVLADAVSYAMRRSGPPPAAEPGAWPAS